MAYDKPELERIWAEGGAVVEPSNTKKQLGWVAEVPPHQYENWVQRRQDQFIFHVNERGIPEWDGVTEYRGGVSYTQGSNGVVYKSVVSSGPSGTVQDPTTDASNTYWEKAFADNGDSRIVNAALALRENIKVTVGDGGDFPTINAAVFYLSRYTPDLGVTAEVELQSGFVMNEQLIVVGLNLGWITITGVDAETVIHEPSLTRVLTDNGDKPAFGVLSGTLPTIGHLFRFSSKGDPADLRSGVVASRVGRATILEGCGVKNAGDRGLFANQGSTINAAGAIATGAGGSGIQSNQGSTINAAGADASGSGASGFHVSNGSTLNAQNATGTLYQAANTVTFSGIIFQP